jgi:hypothetical protein
MSYKAIYTYAWDLAETGVPAAVDEFLRLGLDTVTIAGSYHAGKFLRPHGSAGKVYFPEDGTVYFNPDPSRYGAIKPVPNSLLPGADMVGALLADGRMAVNVWMVLLHNTRLGMAHPDSVVRNAFGDPYVYNLCTSAPEARAYAIGLCRDVSEAHAISGLSVEAPGFLPYAHGFHHEFGFVRPNRWLDSLLGICFCDHCLAGAERVGIDARALRARIAGDITAYLDGDVDFPDDMAEAFWAADLRDSPDLARYLDYRSATVTSLIADIRAALRPEIGLAVIPSVARPTAGAWYEGTDLKAVAGITGCIEACFYEPSAARVRAELWDLKRRLGPDTTLRAILRPSWPDLADRADFLAAIAALKAGGVSELAFYNWGHLRRRNLAWIGEALRENP